MFYLIGDVSVAGLPHGTFTTAVAPFHLYSTLISVDVSFGYFLSRRVVYLEDSVLCYYYPTHF